MVTAQLDTLKERCRELGMNVTPQRIVVYKALLEAEDHPTPEALFATVRREMPSISQATIYKTLEALQKLGVCREVSRLGEPRRFDANLGHHHHLVCTHCGRVIDYDDAELDALKPPDRIDGFIPDEVSVQILGSCSACAGAEAFDDDI